jgi:hypothetical protein
MLRRPLLFLAVLLAAAPAGATLVPIAQERYVRSFGTVTAPPESDSDDQRADAPDFGDFDELVGIAVRAGAGSADGFAEQQSSLGSTSITLTALADAFVAAFGFEDFADAGSTARFEVEFTVSAGQSYQLDASGFVSNNGFASIGLQSGADSLFYFDASQEAERHETLFLPAGSYSLFADVSASAFLFGGEGASDGRAGLAFQLAELPEPAAMALLAVAVASCFSARTARRKS